MNIRRKALWLGATLAVLAAVPAQAQEKLEDALAVVLVSDVPGLLEEGGKIAAEIQPGLDSAGLKSQIALMLGDPELEGLPKGSDAAIISFGNSPLVFVEVGGGKAEDYAKQIANFGQKAKAVDGVVVVAQLESDLKTAEALAPAVKSGLFEGSKAPSVGVTVRMQKVMSKYGKEIDQALGSLNEMLSQEADSAEGAAVGLAQSAFRLYANAFYSIAKQVDTVEVKVDMPGKGVQITKITKPLAGTNLAALINAEKPAGKDLTGLLPGAGGLRSAGTMNVGAMLTFVEKDIDSLIKGTSVTKEQATKLIEFGRKAETAFGGNFAQTAMLPEAKSLTSGANIYEVKDPAAAEAMIKNMASDIESAGILELYKALGMKTSISVGEPEKVDGVNVYTVDMRMDLEDEKAREAFSKMFPDGFKYRMGIAGNYSVIAVGDTKIETLIAAAKAGKAPDAKPLVSREVLPEGQTMYIDISVSDYIEFIARAIASEDEGDAKSMREVAEELKGVDPVMIAFGSAKGELTGRILIPTNLIAKGAKVAQEQAAKQQQAMMKDMEDTMNQESSATDKEGSKEEKPSSTPTE